MPGDYILAWGRPRLVTARESPGEGRGASLRLHTTAPGSEAVEARVYPPGWKPRLARVTRPSCLYQFGDGDSLVFLDPATFEQYHLPRPPFEGRLPYLKEGWHYRIIVWRGRALSLEIPHRLEFRVVAVGLSSPPPPETPGLGYLAVEGVAALKEEASPPFSAGQPDSEASPRVPGATRAAMTETGLILRVPFTVRPGDRILVDTRTNEYLERLGPASGRELPPQGQA
jgi:elongation factor P